MNRKNISLILLGTAAAFFVSAMNAFALTDLEKCENENTALRVELERHRNIEETLSSQIQELQNEKKELTSQSSAKDKQISELESRAKKAEDEKAAADAKAEQDRQTNEAKSQADAEKISSLEGENKDLQAKNRDLEQKNKELEDKNSKDKQDCDRREKELLAQIDKLKRDLEQKNSELENRISEDNEISNNREKELLAQIDRLNRELEAKEPKEQLETKDGENKNGESERSTDSTNRKELNNEISNNRENELLAQIDRLSRELEECKELAKANENRNNASVEADKTKIASLEASVDELTAQLEECNSLLERCRDRVREQQDRIKRLEAQRDEFREELRKELESGDIRMRDDVSEKERIVININDSISFGSGSAELKDEVLPTLDKIANVLRNYPDHRIIVEGHSDSDRIVSSGFASNQDLSEARAQSVLDYLVIRSRLNESNFSVRGYGDTRPIAPNDTEQNKALNRRVDIIVVPAGADRN